MKYFNLLKSISKDVTKKVYLSEGYFNAGGNTYIAEPNTSNSFFEGNGLKSTPAFVDYDGSVISISSSGTSFVFYEKNHNDNSFSEVGRFSWPLESYVITEPGNTIISSGSEDIGNFKVSYYAEIGYSAYQENGVWTVTYAAPRGKPYVKIEYNVTSVDLKYKASIGLEFSDKRMFYISNSFGATKNEVSDILNKIKNDYDYRPNMIIYDDSLLQNGEDNVEEFFNMSEYDQYKIYVKQIQIPL